MSQSTALVPAIPAVPIVSAPPSQADNDEHLLRLWIHGKSENTREAYARDVLQFLHFSAAPLQALRLDHLQEYGDHLRGQGLAVSTVARKLSAVKSLLSFGQKVGYLVYNVGASVPAPKVKDTLAERILSEPELQRILAFEENPRNHALLRLFYATGGRVSELCDLKVRDVQPRRDVRTSRDAGQVTLFGKGGKTRSVLVSPETWADLQPLLHRAALDEPVFRSRKGGGHLHRSQMMRIVRRAALRAGISKDVSPHWFRHAHASHALDRGAPAHLVRDTLGHASLTTTNRYLHARPDQSSSQYLGV